MPEPIEIRGEFCEPASEIVFVPLFDRILALLDTWETHWRNSDIDELADAAVQMSETMHQYQLKTEIDAAFTESYVEPTYLETVLEYIKFLEKRWRDSRNSYLADAASQLIEAISIYRQESEE